jgi:hypothetical protein
VSDEKRHAAREAREREALAAAIERCWISRFGRVAVIVEPTLAQLKRGD